VIYKNTGKIDVKQFLKLSFIVIKLFSPLW